MADLSLEVRDFDRTLAALDRRIRELEAVGDDRWLVGTGVRYAIFLEFGTSEMDPKPFVRPALRRVAGRVERIARDTRDPERLVQRIAFELEAEIKRVITEKGLIDTGTLRASVRALPARGAEFPDADAVEPAAEADVEVAA